mmetsp:Transcript_1044/g.1753  ORF Transcript_1044/g.1753 Transcript_1044/m.1753 type:complete len:268 (+) Transcript_1044:817-1620(+)
MYLFVARSCFCFVFGVCFRLFLLHNDSERAVAYRFSIQLNVDGVLTSSRRCIVTLIFTIFFVNNSCRNFIASGINNFDSNFVASLSNQQSAVVHCCQNKRCLLRNVNTGTTDIHAGTTRHTMRRTRSLRFSRIDSNLKWTLLNCFSVQCSFQQVFARLFRYISAEERAVIVIHHIDVNTRVVSTRNQTAFHINTRRTVGRQSDISARNHGVLGFLAAHRCRQARTACTTVGAARRQTGHLHLVRTLAHRFTINIHIYTQFSRFFRSV